MPETHLSKPTLSFAKLVANPTETAWSQAYNAGNLFVSLALTAQEPTEEAVLPSLGKDVFNVLQSEFFGLEEKNADTIKEAIHVCISKVPDDIEISLVMANFKDNALTVFITGSGRIVMKRKDKVGILLEKLTTPDRETKFASGFLENTDTIVLQTGQFAQGIPHESVQSALDLELPNDIVETLSPPVHEQENGAQAAIVVRYNGPAAHQLALDTEQQELQSEEATTNTENDALDENQENTTTDDNEPDTKPDLVIHESHQSDDTDDDEVGEKKSKFALPSFSSLSIPDFGLSHKRKLYLSIAIILFILLGASVFFTMQKQAETQRLALFNQIYPAALKEYETAQGIESLNPEGSRENYLQAKSKLEEGEEKIAKGTPEYKQIEELLAKVNAALSGTKEEETVGTTKEATPDKNTLIAVAKDNPTAKGFGQNTTTIFMVSADSVTSVTKSNGTEDELVANNDDWSSPQAVVPYQTNFYVLDQKNGVLKFVPAGESYAKSSYFTGKAPNLTQATGMAIDSSVWIVTKDGKILKYTRGAQDTFGLSGLNKPLNNPTKIITDGTMDSVYIMDNGNKRIVQIDKKGVFKKEYPAGVIASATEFEIDQKNNRILILANTKVYELPL